MKKFFALLLALSLTISLCGCGQKDQPADEIEEKNYESEKILFDCFTEIPDYSLNEGASTQEIRDMAVKAMNDELTVPWFTARDFTYGKSVNKNSEIFEFKATENYKGLPYTGAGVGLLHWLQFYDFNSGLLTGIDLSQVGDKLGNSCASSVYWGWSAVAPSFKGVATYHMLPQYGALKVGNYKMDEKLATFKNYSTEQICIDNGAAVMYDAYAKTLPADGLVSIPKKGSGDHAMMVSFEPQVSYTATGEIDGKNSFLIIQDQRAGHRDYKGDYIKDEESAIYHYGGRVSAIVSFEKLFNEGYIPFTLPEFIGTKPYVVPQVMTSNSKPKSLEEVWNTVFSCDYKMINVSITVTNKKTGKEVVTNKKIMFNEDIKSKKAFNTKIGQAVAKSTVEQKLKKGTTYNVKVSSLIATGQTFTPIDVDIKY